MNKRTYLVSVFAILILLSGVAQADFVFDGWNGGTIDGWLAATGDSVIEAQLTGGYSGGYLRSTEPLFIHGIVGAINYGAEYTGDFNAHGYVRMQVAVKFFTGSFYTAYFHVRYMSSANNGWKLPLNVDFENPDWQLFLIDFDPSWTDQQAQAAGWEQEAVSPSFASTMIYVYSSGIKAHGTGALSMGIDHFSLQDPATSAVDMTWGEIKTLYR